MESYISKDAPEPGQLTAGSTSPIVEGLTTADIREAREFLRENDIFKNVQTEGLLFEFVANAPCTFGGNHTNVECECDPYDHGDIVEPSSDPDFHKTRVIPPPPPPPPRRQVETAIRKTVCAIRHIPSGEYVTRGFRGTTKDPRRIKFWDRKADAKKVLSSWFYWNRESTSTPADFEFIEREVFLPSTETF